MDDTQVAALNSQLPQPAQSPPAVMPSQPEALSNVSAYPSLQVADRRPCFSQSVVSPPASHVSVPVITQLVAGATSPRIPDLTNPSFESFHTLWCYSDPLPAVQSKAQELTFPDPPRPALGGIHL